MRLVVAAAAALIAVLGAGSAEATPTSRLTYVRGPGAQACPDESELRRAVADRLGYDPFFPWAARTVVAQIERNAAGFAAELKILDASGVSIGERSLPTRSSDCLEVVRSLALAVSIAIDDLDAASPPPPPPRDPAPRSPPVEPPPPAAPSPPPAVAEQRAELPPREAWHPRISAELAAVGGLGSAPSPSLGGSFGAYLAGRRWAVGLEGRLDAPASAAISGGGRVQSSLALGEALGCIHAGQTFRPFVCAFAALGSFSATTSDVVTPRKASAMYFGMGARVGAELSLSGPLYLVGHLGALGTLSRHSALLDGTPVFTLPPISGELAAGIGIHIL